MLRRLHAARRLGGLVTALPRAAEPLNALRVVCGASLPRAAAAQEAPRSEGCSRSAVTRTLGTPRGFAAAAGSGDGPAEPPVPAVAPTERESAGAIGNTDDDAGPAPPDASVARAPTRAKRASHVGVHGEKTARGRPKPDVRTVARLVELGWWDTAEAAETMLTRLKTHKRFAFETAGPAIDWLINTLGEEKHSSGRCLAAHAVHRFPLILAYKTSTLQRGWEVVTLQREAGGLGLSEGVARKRFAGQPQLHLYTKESVQKRAAFLETLGVPDGRTAIAGGFTLLGFAEKRLRSNAEWFGLQGLDVKQVLSSNPWLITRAAKNLSPKIDFMLNVVCLNADNLAGLLTFSLENTLRPRFFYAMQQTEKRYTLSSLVKCSDAIYMKMIHRLKKPAATVNEIAAYKAHIASPAFLAYMDEQEQAIRARGPHVTPGAI